MAVLLLIGSPNFEIQKSSLKNSDLRQGSLNYLFWRDETMQIYGKFEEFPYKGALFGLVI